MKNIIKFVRGIHPFIFLPFLFILTMVYFSIFRSVRPEFIIGTIMAETFIIISAIFILNLLTKGSRLSDTKEKNYISEVAVSYFGENVRWAGYFKYKHTALFSAIYQAWYLDHFGNVSSDCGIKYYVNSVK